MGDGQRSGDTVIKVRCGWCGRDIGEKAGHGMTGPSDGLCPDCEDGLRLKAGLPSLAEEMADGHEL